jgi:1,2-diacylglycerol 3-beta-glucosyltransferase
VHPVTWLSALLAVPGFLAALSGLYLLALAAASFARPPATTPYDPESRLAVIVPAHNEVDLIGRCVSALIEQDYPSDRFDIFVVADNCSDATAEVAEEAGAHVLVRDAPDQRGKGRALRWAMDHLLAIEEAFDAFVIVDADSVADKELLRGLAVAMGMGAEAVQAEYLVLQDDSSYGTRLRSVAFLLFHRVRFSGRAALHLPCNLVGNGMLLARSLVVRHPWNAFSGAEDLEYSITLRLHGVRPVFARSALIRGPVPASAAAVQVQRERWEGGRLHVLRLELPVLLREIVVRRRVSLIDAAVDLAVPPLGLLAIGCVAGTGFAFGLWAVGLVPTWLVAVWLVSLASISGFVILGLFAADAPAWMYGALLNAPVFLARKAAGTIGVLRSRPADTWIRTERPSEIGR